MFDRTQALQMFESGLQHTSTMRYSVLLLPQEYILNMTASSSRGPSSGANPNVSRCLMKSCVLKHFVNKSATFCKPGRCLKMTSPVSSFDLNHRSRISMCLERLGMSIPCSSWMADAESVSRTIGMFSCSLINPIPWRTR